jgi:predicted dehydrogenase
MQDTIRLGVAGCGTHTRRSHLKHCAAAGFTVSAIFDPAQASRDATFELLGAEVPVCDSAEELVTRGDVDAVLIGSPNKFHPEQLRLAIEAGKPVLCEKPLANTHEGMVVVRQALLDAALKGVVVASCHPRRDRHNIDMPYGWVKNSLNRLRDRFGRLESIGLSSAYERVEKDQAKDLSFLMDKFPHDIDYLRFLFGNTALDAECLMDSHDHYRVKGTVSSVDDDCDVEFVCECTRLHGAHREYIETITLTFERGVCVVYTMTGAVRYYDRKMHTTWEGSAITPLKGDDAYDRVFRAIMQDFAGAIRGEAGVHTADDLLINNMSTVDLAGQKGRYQRITH